MNTMISPRESAIPIRPHRLWGKRGNRIRQRIYEILVGPVTELCYQAGLNYFPDNAAILDVGIGNGFMIRRCHELIRSKGLKITGIDISAESLEQCLRRIRTYGLEEQIELHLAPIEDFQPDIMPQFDFIFFSMSFMLLDDQKGVLDRVRRMVPHEGEIVFFQTMYTEKLPIMDFIKPRLKYITGIDFGPVSYEEDFFPLLRQQRMTVKEDRLLQKKWFQGEYRMIVASPGTALRARGIRTAEIANL